MSQGVSIVRLISELDRMLVGVLIATAIFFLSVGGGIYQGYLVKGEIDQQLSLTLAANDPKQMEVAINATLQIMREEGSTIGKPAVFYTANDSSDMGFLYWTLLTDRSILKGVDRLPPSSPFYQKAILDVHQSVSRFPTEAVSQYIFWHSFWCYLAFINLTFMLSGGFILTFEFLLAHLPAVQAPQNPN